MLLYVTSQGVKGPQKGIIMGLVRTLAGFVEKTTRGLSKVEPQNYSFSAPCFVELS